MRCTLPTDFCGSTGFRLIFTPDVSSPGCYKLNASNPGQFYYNVFASGTPGGSLTFTVTLPYPFVTQGANPIEVYDGVDLQVSGGQTCLLPANKTFAGSQYVTLASYGSTPVVGVTTYDLVVTVPVPATGFVFLAIHLDYGLKGTGGYNKDAISDGLDDAVACGTSAVVIPDMQDYTFSVSGSGGLGGSSTVKSCNRFKRNPGVGGGVMNTLTDYRSPGVSATLKDSKGALLVSGVTDEDGWYMLSYSHRGKEATFYVTVTPPGGRAKTQTIKLKANRYAEVNFTIP
jgi:hypothetical protein